MGKERERMREKSKRKKKKIVKEKEISLVQFGRYKISYLYVKCSTVYFN